MTECYIYDHVRTPRGKGKKDGALHEVTALQLATQVLVQIRERNKLDTSIVDDVVMGCVSPINEQGSVIPRTAVLMADYAETTSGVQVNRFCGSGLEATNMAAAQIMSGQSQMAIGGGVESMSRVAILSDKGAWPADPASAFKNYFIPQGISADVIATKNGFSRTDVDTYAVESQKRASNAWDKGYFKNSVAPVKDMNGLTILARDEHVRADTTLQSLGALKPSFVGLGEFAFNDVAIQRYPEVERVNHVHTAGNSSGIVDGAAGILLGTKEAGAAQGLKPRAKIRAFASIGSEPAIMLTGPEFVAQKVMKRAGMSVKDLDLIELNEAFAAVVLRTMQVLDIPHDKMNVNGGAIAMGHPLGATGAIILGTLLDELERRNLSTGLAMLCIGAGMGVATIIERV